MRLYPRILSTFIFFNRGMDNKINFFNRGMDKVLISLTLKWNCIIPRIKEDTEDTPLIFRFLKRVSPYIENLWN